MAATTGTASTRPGRSERRSRLRYPHSASSTQAAESEAASTDPTTGLRAVAALRELLERSEALQVGNARAEGWSWQQIAKHPGAFREHTRASGRGGIRTHERVAPLTVF